MVIGITGGVGSGKSTVVKILEKDFGAGILIADEIGHEAMEPGCESYDKIRHRFGDKILCEDGRIDRAALADIIFADPAEREDLNAIIHPFVIKRIREELEKPERKSLVAVETALLFETGCDSLCDEVWGVVAERETRIRRLMDSRGYTREKAESIMAGQLPDHEWRERCDKVLCNDGSEADLKISIKNFLNKLKKS